MLPDIPISGVLCRTPPCVPYANNNNTVPVICQGSYLYFAQFFSSQQAFLFVFSPIFDLIRLFFPLFFKDFFLLLKDIFLLFAHTPIE